MKNDKFITIIKIACVYAIVIAIIYIKYVKNALCYFAQWVWEFLSTALVWFLKLVYPLFGKSTAGLDKLYDDSFITPDRTFLFLALFLCVCFLFSAVENLRSNTRIKRERD